MSNNHKHVVTKGVLIGRDYWAMPIRVELQVYLRFSRRLDKQLRWLVVRWAHAASPSARGLPATAEPAEAYLPPTL